MTYTGYPALHTVGTRSTMIPNSGHTNPTAYAGL